MAKIITIEYEYGTERISPLLNPIVAYRTFFCGIIDDGNKAFSEATELLAKSYIKHGKQANFGIIDSMGIGSICLENQCFFPKDLETALVRNGVQNVRVRGLMGGSYENILKRIKEDSRPGEEIEYLDGIKSAEYPVLYKFETPEEYEERNRRIEEAQNKYEEKMRQEYLESRKLSTRFKKLVKKINPFQR